MSNAHIVPVVICVGVVKLCYITITQCADLVVITNNITEPVLILQSDQVADINEDVGYRIGFESGSCTEIMCMRNKITGKSCVCTYDRIAIVLPKNCIC